MKRALVFPILLVSMWRSVFMPESSFGQQKVQQTEPKSPIHTLITLAEAAEPAASRDAVNDYNEFLIKMLVSPQAGEAYVTAFSQRVGMADLMARHGHRKLISESSVAQAFNELMTQVADPQFQPPKTDAATVHKLRLMLKDSSPALSSVETHESECLPSEAFLLMTQLINNNPSYSGAPTDRKPDDRETWSAICTVDEWIAIPAVTRIEHLAQTVVTSRNIRRDRGMARVGCPAFENGKRRLGKSNLDNAALYTFNIRSRRRSGQQLIHKEVQASLFALNLNKYALRVIPNKTSEIQAHSE